MGLGFASETLPFGENRCANGGKNRRNKIALLGETFRGNRQRNFLFDLFLSKCAEGLALSLSSVRDGNQMAETSLRRLGS